MSESKNYGQFYWCVKVPKSISLNGEIYVWADLVRIDQSGCLIFVRCDSDESDQINLALPPGNWISIFSASIFDGHAIACEHWKGEVES